MTTLARWNPFSEIVSLRDRMDRLFEEVWHRQPTSGNGEITPWSWMPALDFSETDGEYIVRLEVPGMKQEDIDVTLQGNVLTIRGKRELREERKDETVHAAEFSYGSFFRTLRLPAGVKPDGVNATYKDGVLEIRLSKSDENKPKKIELQAV